ncbi:MAG: acetate--CoA ligase family protein [Pseudomonadota bacterium]
MLKRDTASMKDLSRLFRPSSIAVIGGGWGLAVIEQCQKMGFQGDIWPVHPKHKEIHGLPCYRSVDDLPAAPDATFIGVNRHLTIETVRALSAREAGGAICFASGFAEAEDDRDAGQDLQEALLDAAGDMPVVGPNCYGLINYLDGALLWPDQHGGTRVESGVALLTQSSNLLINLSMQRRGLPMAYCLTAGNQAQVGLSDMGLAVLEDERVTALGLHIEGVDSIRGFEALAAQARELKKPVIAIKVGRSEQAQQATISHTASLAGGDAASRAFLNRLGIPVMDGLPEWLEALKLAHVHGVLPGRTICSMSCSGGEASLIADAAYTRNVDLRPLTDAEHDRVKATLSDLVAVANPLDYHTFIWGDADRMAATYTAMIGCGFDLTFLVYDFPRLDRCDDAAWECGATAIIQAQKQTGARVAVVASLAESMPEARAAQFMAAGIAPMIGLNEALAATEAMASIGEVWARPLAEPVFVPEDGGNGVHTLSEAEAKAVLDRHGVAIPRNLTVKDADGTGAAADDLGYPVVLKATGIAHKTEAGGVALNLKDRAAVIAAASVMPECDAFLIEAMITGTVAELIVGVVRDPVYGMTLTIGAGGVLTELLRDSTTLLVPSDRIDIERALDDLTVSKLLNGYRGAKPADRTALIEAILNIQAVAIDLGPSLMEMDVNPLMATPDAAIAADALIKLAGPSLDD